MRQGHAPDIAIILTILNVVLVITEWWIPMGVRAFLCLAAVALS